MTRCMILAAVLAVSGILAGQSYSQAAEADDDADKTVRELELKSALPRRRGSAQKPTVIKDEKELKETFPDEALRKEIAADIDFSKQQLLYFAWAGSGRDRLTAKVVGEGEPHSVEFHYQRGLTRDLRPHAHLFAIGRDVKWSVTVIR